MKKYFVLTGSLTILVFSVFFFIIASETETIDNSFYFIFIPPFFTILALFSTLIEKNSKQKKRIVDLENNLQKEKDKNNRISDNLRSSKERNDDFAWEMLKKLLNNVINGEKSEEFNSFISKKIIEKLL